MTAGGGAGGRPATIPGLSIGLPEPGEGLVSSYRDIPGFVATVEQSGAAQVGLPDRLLMTADMIHPGGGRYPGEPTKPYVEPLVMLGAIAVATEFITLTTGVLLAPLRQPVALAKAAATVDVLSGGRLELGFGSGWFEPEFEAIGGSVDERFARLEETIQICRILWSESPATFHGRWSSFDEVTSRPAPVNGRIPIWIGTQARPSPRTVRRVAEWGDGWAFSSRSTLEDIIWGSELLVEACAKVGRDPNAIPLRAQVRRPVEAGTTDGMDLEREIELTIEAILPYADAGVDFVTCGYGSARDVDEAAAFVKGVHNGLARECSGSSPR
jgi:probable F420-dependent oxidoreductase